MEWIKTKTRKPKEEAFIAAINDNNDGMVGEAFYEKFNGKNTLCCAAISGDMMITHVIYWMPLPYLPESVQE